MFADASAATSASSLLGTTTRFTRTSPDLRPHRSNQNQIKSTARTRRPSRLRARRGHVHTRVRACAHMTMWSAEGTVPDIVITSLFSATVYLRRAGQTKHIARTRSPRPSVMQQRSTIRPHPEGEANVLINNHDRRPHEGCSDSTRIKSNQIKSQHQITTRRHKPPPVQQATHLIARAARRSSERWSPPTHRTDASAAAMTVTSPLVRSRGRRRSASVRRLGRSKIAVYLSRRVRVRQE
jgi:hypothetical protein